MPETTDCSGTRLKNFDIIDVDLKTGIFFFLLLAASAIGVILWPQEGQSPAAFLSAKASPDSSAPQPPQHFSSRDSTGQSGDPRMDENSAAAPFGESGSRASRNFETGADNPGGPSSGEDSPALDSVLPPRDALMASSYSPHAAAGAAPAPVPDPAANNLIPVAFAQPSPGDQALTPAEQQVLANMRQNFSDSMRQDGLNPNDPAYLQRWTDLQSSYDQWFHTEFGDAAYEAYENSVLHEAPKAQ